MIAASQHIPVCRKRVMQSCQTSSLISPMHCMIQVSCLYKMNNVFSSNLVCKSSLLAVGLRWLKSWDWNNLKIQSVSDGLSPAAKWRRSWWLVWSYGPAALCCDLSSYSWAWVRSQRLCDFLNSHHPPHHGWLLAATFWACTSTYWDRQWSKVYLLPWDTMGRTLTPNSGKALKIEHKKAIIELEFWL